MKQWSRTLAAMACACLVASRATAFQVTLDSGVGSIVILDNAVGDLNPDPGVIDFATTVGGVFRADGRVRQLPGPPDRGIHIGARGAALPSVFANLGVASRAFSVVVESDTFVQTGPPLGWSVLVDTAGADGTSPSQGDVAIPTNDLAVQVDPGSVVLTTASLPITPPVTPADQPVSLSANLRGTGPTTAATALRIVWSFTPGPFDEIRLPNPSAFGDAAVIVNVFDTESKCVVRMNDDATKLARGAGVDDAKCVRSFARTGGDATACVDDPKTKRTDSAETKLIDDFPFYCGTPPPFGTNLGTCCEGGTPDGNPCASDDDCADGSCTAGACISGAAEDTAAAITHDLFGRPAVNVSASTTGRCQAKVAAEIAKLDERRWGVLTECKRRSIATLATAADLVTTCFGPPQPDPSSKIAKAEARLARRLDRDCLARGVSALGSVFPGACAGEPDGDFAACLAQRVACRFCQGAGIADDVASLVDCDKVDDGASNGSCL